MSTALERKSAIVTPGEIAYVDEGSGPSVVLIHGFPTSSHLWRDLVPLLAPRFRTVAPDLIGYGASEKPSGIPLDVRAQAAYVKELLVRLGVEQFAAVGHGLGGGVAQLLALEDGVEALVLIDSVSFGSLSTSLSSVLEQEGAPEDEQLVERFIRLHLAHGLAHRERLDEDDVAEYVRPWREDPPALLRAAEAIEGGDLRGTEEPLRKLDVPALMIWGEDDPYHPSHEAEQLWDVLPAASIALLPGCSHFVTEDAAETVLPLVLQFLKSRYLGEQGHVHQHPAGGVRVDFGVSFERPPHHGDELVDE